MEDVTGGMTPHVRRAPTIHAERRQLWTKLYVTTFLQGSEKTCVPWMCHWQLTKPWSGLYITNLLSRCRVYFDRFTWTATVDAKHYQIWLLDTSLRPFSWIGKRECLDTNLSEPVSALHPPKGPHLVAWAADSQSVLCTTISYNSNSGRQCSNLCRAPAVAPYQTSLRAFR